MKRDLGWGLPTAVALAAVIGISTQHGGRPETEGSARPSVARSEPAKAGVTNDKFEHGPCVEIEKRLQDFLLGGDRTALAAPRSCYDDQTLPPDTVAHPEVLQHAAKGLQFVIATLPDPLYTHFSLSFDRMTEAIQEGSSDSGYVYDSSWLPWDTEEAPFALMSDQEKAEDKRSNQEEQPGVLLFRQKMRERPGGEFRDSQTLFDGGLVIFVVGEDPTQGIHRAQFKNATQWIAALQSDKDADASEVQLPNGGILGPSFSGSLPSLATLLGDSSLKKQWQKTGHAPLLIYSGTISAKTGMNWFEKKVVEHTEGTTVQQYPVRIASFQQNDEDLLDAYCTYLTGEGFHLQNLAILSEDETAYGTIFTRQDSPHPQPSQDNSSCQVNQEKGAHHGEPTGLVRLYYPRGIAALRTAYQKQSIFSTEAPSSSGMERRTLFSNIADPEGQQHDTIRQYNQDQLPQSQEGVLQQIVSQLRAHHSEYVVLRSSNPLDQLFLAHYLRMAYPHGRIVTLGADVLLRRESGAARLSGIMTLTTYPLLPWEPHWTWYPKDSSEATDHSHRVYPQDRVEGLYVATRFLLRARTETDQQKLSVSDFAPIDPTNTLEIPDYGPPRWLKLPQTNTGVAPANAQKRPTGWLSVLGRDDFWPVASLQVRDPSVATKEDGCNGDCWRTYGWLSGAGYSLIKNVPLFWTIRANGAEKDGKNLSQAPMPLGTRAALFLLLFWACFHLACCYWYSITAKPNHRSYFVCFKENYRPHRGLLVLGSLALSAAATTLAWGSGVMATQEEVLPEHRSACALAVLMIWVLAGAALAVNLWKQSECLEDRKMWRSMLAYVLGTVAYYFALYWATERMMSSGNRVPAYWRSMNLTNGVSPIVPFLVLSAGVYLWTWRALQGLAFFGPDQPLLPKAESLEITDKKGEKFDWLNMFSRENAAGPVLKFCKTVSRRPVYVFLIAFAGQWAMIWQLSIDSAEPIRTLGARSYAQFICVVITVIISVMIANAFQLMWIWIELRRLLVHLDRLPLRRTMTAISGFSWNSVWKISGNVLEMRYKLLSTFLECGRHFENSVERNDATPPADGQCESKDSKPKVSDEVAKSLDAFDTARNNFAGWYAKGWKDERLHDQTELQELQEKIAALAGRLLSQMLVPEWRSEEAQLLPCDATEENKEHDGKSPDKNKAKISLAPPIRYAEELVCYVYLGFIQNVLGRMRTLVMGIVGLFIAVSISLASYPFDPRTVVNAVMILLFLALGAMIVTVYAQMHRDPLLSALTNTTPGELDADFWFKLISFGTGPVLGLLATIFPEMTDFLFSWVAPGVSSIK